MTRKIIFLMNKKKQKDAETAAHFQIKATKIAQGYHLKEVCAGGLNFCYFFLIMQRQHFYLLDHWFSGHRLSSPPLVPTRHFHILCKICEHIYRQKLLLAQGGGGGGRYAIKLFLISIWIIVKNTVSAQN